MQMVDPSAEQYRRAGFALVLIAGVTAAMIAVAWVGILDELVLPLVVAHFLFNGGFMVAALKGNLQTKGARLGVTAALLNFAAALLADFDAIWTGLSVCAVVVGVAAAYMLFSDAGASRT